MNGRTTVLRGMETKIRFKEGSYYDPLPPRDIVATSLALHHLATIDRKRKLYRRTHDALDPGGVFINADATMSADPDERAETYRMWRSHMASRGVDNEKADRHFEQWSEEDTYFPIDVELDAMTAAGLDALRLELGSDCSAGGPESGSIVSFTRLRGARSAALMIGLRPHSAEAQHALKHI